MVRWELIQKRIRKPFSADIITPEMRAKAKEVFDSYWLQVLGGLCNKKYRVYNWRTGELEPVTCHCDKCMAETREDESCTA